MSNFSNYKKFENVGIRSSNDTLIVMDSTNNNISLHSSDGGDTNVDTLSIKNIINKSQNEDLNLSSLNGTTINPVITINNNHNDCRIMTNLNVYGNVNIIKNLNVSNTVINNNLIIPKYNSTNSSLLSNVIGSIYYNTTENMYEGYSNERWQPLGGFSKSKDATIYKNLNVNGNINLTSGMIQTTGIGSFGSIRTGVGTFTSIDSGSITTGVGTFAVSNSVSSDGNMIWTGATSNYIFDKQLIINTTGAELSNGHNTYILPSADGTLAVDNPNITFGDLGSGASSISYIYDPRQNSGAPSPTNNALSFHSNGKEVNLNCRVAAGGTSSAVNLRYGGSILYRFNENLTMDVGLRSYSFPSSDGTLALITDIKTYTGTVPIVITGTTISLNGLTGMGTENQIMKVNSSGILAWATDNNDIYTGTAPILIDSSTNIITYDNTTAGTFTNKTFGDMTGFNNGLSVKASGTTVSGYVRFYDKDGTNYIDLHTNQTHTLSNSVNMFLPTPVSTTDSVLVARNSTDTLTNKTITSFIGGSSAVITAPSTTGTLAVANSTIAFGDGGGTVPIERSYIFDPRQNLGVPTSVYNVLSYHNNGTESAINNWSSGLGGLDSHFSINFASAMKFRFHANGVLKVGSNAYSFPTNAGTLALVGETSNWSVSSNIIYPANSAVNTLKMKTIQNPTYSGTKLEQNVDSGWSMYGNDPKYILGLGGTGPTANYPLLGYDAGGFVLHINNAGDCLKIDTSKNTTLYGTLSTTGQGSFGSLTTTGSINTGSGSITTTGQGSFGNVGIGVTSPDAHLHIYKTTVNTTTHTTSTCEPYIRLEANPSTDCDRNDFNPVLIDFKMANDTDDYTNIARIGALISPIGSEGHGTSVGEGSNALVFCTSYNTTLKERMRINHHGYVGIGTINPYSTLDINDNLGLNIHNTLNPYTTVKSNSIQMGYPFSSSGINADTTFSGGVDRRLSNTLTIFSPYKSNIGTRTDGGGTLNGHPFIDLITGGCHNVGYGLRTTIKMHYAGASGCYLGFHMKNGSDSTEYLGNHETAAVYFQANGDVTSATNSYTSDDRIKTDEELIINATNILLKLRPQKYKKHSNNSYIVECGLIAQEIYYEVPELRYIIKISNDAVLIDDNKYRNFEDIRNDPDYSNWGSKKATVRYTNLIGYLIKGFQEQNTIINTQQNEINILKTENQQQQIKMNELTSIIDKLKTANSFEEFKQTL